MQSTTRLRRYGWKTSKEGSLRRKKKKNKVEEIQLANLARPLQATMVYPDHSVQYFIMHSDYQKPYSPVHCPPPPPPPTHTHTEKMICEHFMADFVKNRRF